MIVSFMQSYYLCNLRFYFFLSKKKWIERSSILLMIEMTLINAGSIGVLVIETKYKKITRPTDQSIQNIYICVVNC